MEDKTSLLFSKLLELAVFSSYIFISLCLSEITVFISFPAVPFFPLSVHQLSRLCIRNFLMDAHFPKAELTLTESCHSCQRLLSLVASEKHEV